MKTALVHFAGNAAVLAAAWYWLGIPERTPGHIALSALLAIAVLAGFVCLQCAALCAPLRRAHMVALWLLVIAAVAIFASRIAAALLLVASLPSAAKQEPVIPSPRYVIRAFPLVAAGILLPWALLAWTPALKGLTAQSVSFGIRLLIAYTITVSAWLALTRLAAATKSTPAPPPAR